MADDILSQVSMERLAQRLGTDEASAREAAEAAMPTLLAGMTKEADDPDRRPALASALREDHDPQLLEDEDPFERIDPNEGDKIVNHVFGPQRGQLESDLQGFLGGGQRRVGRQTPADACSAGHVIPLASDDRWRWVRRPRWWRWPG